MLALILLQYDVGELSTALLLRAMLRRMSGLCGDWQRSARCLDSGQAGEQYSRIPEQCPPPLPTPTPLHLFIGHIE